MLKLGCKPEFAYMGPTRFIASRSEFSYVVCIKRLFMSSAIFLCKTGTGITLKVAHTRLPSVGFRSWSRFFAVSLQVTWVIIPTVGCHYFPPGLQLPPVTLNRTTTNLDRTGITLIFLAVYLRRRWSHRGVTQPSGAPRHFLRSGPSPLI